MDAEEKWELNHVYRTLSSPISIQIEITTECNNKCIYCYNFWRHKYQKNYNEIYLTEYQIPRIIDELVKNGVFHVTITGGESLLRKNITLKLIQELIKTGIKCNLNSNLIALDKDFAQLLKNTGLKSILTSLSSYDPQTYNLISGRCNNFDKTIHGIKNAVDAGFMVSVNMVLTKFNKNHVYETARLAKNLGARGFTVTKASPAIGMDKEAYRGLRVARTDLVHALDDLIQAHKDFHLDVDILECYPICFFPNEKKYSLFTKHRCLGGVTTCTIGADGNIRPCSHANLNYGNIFSEPLSEIWKKMEEWRDGSFIPSICKHCQYLKFCSGGCRMEGYYHTGKLDGFDPWANYKDKLNLEKLITSKKKETILKNKEKMKLNPTIKIRKENFGGVLSIKNGSEILVSKDAVKIIDLLKTQKSFCLDSILEKMDVSIKNTTKFLEKLQRGKFIVKI